MGAESTCTSEEQEHAGRRQRNKGAERIPGLDDSSEILWQESYLGGLGIGQAVGSDNLAGAQNGALPLIFSLFCRGNGRLMCEVSWTKKVGAGSPPYDRSCGYSSSPAMPGCVLAPAGGVGSWPP